MVTEVTFPSDSPFFKGHFPGSPITPGVMLMAEAVANAEKMLGFGIALTCVKKVKFTNPVLPDEPVTLDLSMRNENEIAYSFTKDGIQCASGILVSGRSSREK